MFNPHQRGGIGTVTGDIDRAAHTPTDSADWTNGRREVWGAEHGVNHSGLRIYFSVFGEFPLQYFFMHINKKQRNDWRQTLISMLLLIHLKGFRDMWRKHVWLLFNIMELSGTMPMKKYIGIKKVTTSVSRNLVVSSFFSLWNYTCQLHHRAKGSMHLSAMRCLWWDSETERQHWWWPPSC